MFPRLVYFWFRVCSACIIAFIVDFFAFLFWRCRCRCPFRLTDCVSLFCVDFFGFGGRCLAFFGWCFGLGIVVDDVCIMSLLCSVVMFDFVFSHI